MSNEQEILNLIAQYTHHLDQDDFDGVGNIFHIAICNII